MVNDTYRSYQTKIPNQNFRIIDGKQPWFMVKSPEVMSPEMLIYVPFYQAKKYPNIFIALASSDLIKP